MSTLAPAACRVRVISAPMRRAPPVIRTTWPLRGKLSIGDAMRRNDTGMSPQRVLGRNGAPVRERSSVGREIRLSTDEVQHTRRVAAYLADEIAASGGWIGFERYMEIVLYAPGLGYYSAGARKLGPGGDFTTAPEISSLFGACVAQQCADVLRDLGGGSIMEIGAGSGGLAADILSRLDALGRLPKRYLMLDVSTRLARPAAPHARGAGAASASTRALALGTAHRQFRRRRSRQRGAGRIAGVAHPLACHALRGVGGRRYRQPVPLGAASCGRCNGGGLRRARGSRRRLGGWLRDGVPPCGSRRGGPNSFGR